MVCFRMSDENMGKPVDLLYSVSIVTEVQPDIRNPVQRIKMGSLWSTEIIVAKCVTRVDPTLNNEPGTTLIM